MASRSAQRLRRRLNEARGLHQAGRLLEASRIYSELLRQDPDFPEALHGLGVAFAQRGNISQAESHLKQALTLAPRNADIVYDFGALRDAQGRFDEAEALFLKAAELDVSRVDVWLAMAAYCERRNDAQGLARARFEIARRSPEEPEWHLNMALSLPASEAIDYLTHQIEATPQLLKALLPALADLLMGEDRLEEALIALQTLKVNGSTIPFLDRYLGVVLARLNRPHDAVRALDEAVQGSPQDVTSWEAYGDVLETLTDGESAAAAFDRASELAPDELRLTAKSVHALMTAATPEEALPRARSAPDPLKKILLASAIPAVADSNEEIDMVRKRWQMNMESLANDPIPFPNAWESVGLTPFALGYHGRNDRPLIEAFSRAMLAIDPDLGYVSSNLEGSTSGRIRIGFVSAHLRRHAVGRVLNRLIGALNRDHIETIFFATPAKYNSGRQDGENVVERTIALPPNLDRARSLIEAESVDILFYPDLHLDPFTDALSFSRLAPIQATTWGHPGTSGRPTIDYWLSYQGWEPEGSEQFYSEQLVRLDATPMVVELPTLPAAWKTRADFGLPEGGRLYGCLQSIFKFHPDFDAYLAGILEQDPSAHLIIANSGAPRWMPILKRRLARTLDISRVHVLPKISGLDYFAATRLCDVLLDPIHFGGANTTLDALAVGRAVVTQPGDQMRGRATQGFLRQIEFVQAIASSREDYVNRAVELASQSTEFWTDLQDRSQALFDDLTPVRSFERWIHSVVPR